MALETILPETGNIKNRIASSTLGECIKTNQPYNRKTTRTVGGYLATQGREGEPIARPTSLSKKRKVWAPTICRNNNNSEVQARQNCRRSIAEKKRWCIVRHAGLCGCPSFGQVSFCMEQPILG